MREFRACVIGTGFVGKIHVETLRRLGNVQVTAVADPINAQAAAAQLGVPRAYTDYRQMINEEKPDVAHICTPNNTHFDIAMFALEHGVNLICEKPMTTTIEQAEQLVRKANETGLTVALNFHNRFYPMTNHLRNVVRDGELGDIFSVTGSYMQDWLLYDTDYSWRLSAEESGRTRAVADIGSHWMDLAEYVSGQKITKVCADFSIIHETRQKPCGTVLAFSTERTADTTPVPINTEDSASVMFRFSGGAKGSAFFSQVIAGRSVDIDLTLGGYQKSAEWRSMTCNQLVIGNRDSYNEVREKGFATVHPDTVPLVAYPFGHAEGFADAFKQCFRQVYRSLEDTSAPRDFATCQDGLHEMVVCERIFESNERRAWVDV